MTVPVAVSPSNPTPGLHIRVDLLRGSVSPAIAGLRGLIITPPETGQGDLAVNTVREVFSADDVRTACGRSLGYFAYKILQLNDKKAAIDLVVCAESTGVAATQTLTFAGTPTVDSGWLVNISGYDVEFEWPVGLTASDAAIANAPKVNAIGDSIFCVATTSTGNVVLTARSKGTAGNDVTVSVKKLRGTGATLTAGGATLTGGTLEVDMTGALAAAAVKEYDFILPCSSNADATSASGTSNSARLGTHINSLVNGLDAKLQQGIYASTSTRAAAATNAAARNHTNLQHVCFQNSRDLPCEVAAAEMGDRLSRRRNESNANRVRQPLRGLRGAADPTVNTPTETQFISSSNSGVTNYGYNANGTPTCLRPITTYSKDTNGNQDRRVFDVNEVDAIYDYVKDLRTAIPAEFQAPDAQVKVMRDRTSDDDPLPENTVEERDIKAFIIARTLAFWVPKGVINGPAFQAAVDDGTFVVEINDQDETQVDIFLPVRALKIAAKFGLYVAKEG